MTDIRARLADALREHGNSGKPTWANERLCICGETFRTMPPGPDFADHLVGVLLSLDGIAIVELPEPHSLPRVKCWFTPIGNVVIDGEDRLIYREGIGISSSDDLRSLAASLLDAANKTEQA